MKRTQLKILIKNYWPLCTAAVSIAFMINHFGTADDADMLKWILTPTARWASILSGIPFEYLPHQGYVNHFYQFLIAPSCAGGRFMLLTFLMLTFSFLPSVVFYGNDHDVKKEYLWFGASLVMAYASTVFVNGIRIVISIHLPGILEKRDLLRGWLTPDRLHTLIGTVSYFTFLCVIYLLASFLRRRLFSPSGTRSSLSSTKIFTCFTKYGRLSAPVFWYLMVVLALPFVKRIYLNEWEGFGQYAALILCVCAGVCAGFAVIGKIRKQRVK